MRCIECGRGRPSLRGLAEMFPVRGMAFRYG